VALLKLGGAQRRAIEDALAVRRPATGDAIHIVGNYSRHQPSQLGWRPATRETLFTTAFTILIAITDFSLLAVRASTRH